MDRIIEEANTDFEALLTGVLAEKDPERATQTPDQVAAPIENNGSRSLPIFDPTAPAQAKWTPLEAPEGVVLTDRTIREIRRERRYAEDRLADGLKMLGLYRSMRTGGISYDAYREATRQEHLEDTPCFADSNSLKTFDKYCNVVACGKKYVLDLHLKWGKGSNAVSAVRIYYTWDEASQRVIVGSAPRHGYS